MQLRDRSSLWYPCFAGRDRTYYEVVGDEHGNQAHLVESSPEPAINMRNIQYKGVRIKAAVSSAWPKHLASRHACTYVYACSWWYGSKFCACSSVLLLSAALLCCVVGCLAVACLMLCIVKTARGLYIKYKLTCWMFVSIFDVCVHILLCFWCCRLQLTMQMITKPSELHAHSCNTRWIAEHKDVTVK